ncbi:MAG: NUDIX domain-containing protein [Dehalococcoidia bacterium]|nr:NUDIX domain-containing protein [Dehalococcoidia bacterium]MSQ16717.1 NUDIX domain-containing protein [Dehalococcoidia bacterium]
MPDILESSTNPFGGVIPKPAALPGDPQEFRRRLQDSLPAWRAKGFKVVWLEVPTAKAAVIPVAVEAGFEFHHTGHDYLMLTHRLVEGAFVPPYASHYIGAGGVVLNDRSELLVVCERHRATAALSFKLPGGALQPGEHLVDAVIREVLEETGVRTRFDALVCLRHWHGYRYGKSDIYFVCRLSPLSQDITMQTEEIEECQWMPVGQYLEAGNVSAFNKHIVQAALESPGLAPIHIDGFADPEKREFFMPRNPPGNGTSPLL